MSNEPQNCRVPSSEYVQWPISNVSRFSQRTELDQLAALGHQVTDPRQVVDDFEATVARFVGAQEAVAVDSCSHGIFLCLKYLSAFGAVAVPRHTYLSVPMQIIHAGGTPTFQEVHWSGEYRLDPFPIWDAAALWKRNMYHGEFQVVSFQYQKALQIGRGGMIFTDDTKAAAWLRRARHDGRDPAASNWRTDRVTTPGWHYYMTPEDAARGLLMVHEGALTDAPLVTWRHYPDISRLEVFSEI